MALQAPNFNFSHEFWTTRPRERHPDILDHPARPCAHHEHSVGKKEGFVDRASQKVWWSESWSRKFESADGLKGVRPISQRDGYVIDFNPARQAAVFVGNLQYRHRTTAGRRHGIRMCPSVVRNQLLPKPNNPIASMPTTKPA
jgi:hypothetical protein